MTLWAFFSDVHGNRRGLERVAALGASRGVDAYICLGDVIGRGDPDGCVKWVAERTVIALSGNRDRDHADWVDPSLRQLVGGWPRQAAESDFLLTHGDSGGHPLLRSTAEKKGFRGVAEYLSSRQARIWLFGHTHHHRIWSLGENVQLLSETQVKMEPGLFYVVNVGTTGRPFPGKGPASMVLYDDVGESLERLSLDA